MVTEVLLRGAFTDGSSWQKAYYNSTGLELTGIDIDYDNERIKITKEAYDALDTIFYKI